MNVPNVVGVLGAGIMGSGIAQLAAQAGARTLLYDPVPGAAEGGRDRIRAALDRLVAKGRLEAAVAAQTLARIETVQDVAGLADCTLVIEAAPEQLALKLDVLGRVAAVVAPDCVIATNTSSLSVTEIAAGVPGSERVVGMHFFNPAPVMRLVEVIGGEDSGAAALATTRALGEAMGKHVIDAQDVAGFLVNRVNRPYSLEALRLLQEQLASVEALDRIARLGGGFRMGPFELMDLIGIETNHAVAEGFLRQTYGEVRYRPSPLAARKIAAGRLGRKTGQGWYAYTDGAEHRPADPPAPDAGGGDGRPVVITGDLPLAHELRVAATAARWSVRTESDGRAPWLTVDCAGLEAERATPEGPRARLLHTGSLHALEPTAAGFHALSPFEACGLVETTSTELSDPEAVIRSAAFFTSLGRHVEAVGDAPGLVLGRVVCQLINEAAFLVGEGNGTPDDVDAGMELGVNHPRGPVAWSRALGLAHVVAVLDALHRELGEDRYRAAPLLRKRLAIGRALG
ncbi:MAG: 3-hydroxybutyryl-CoA dehydrogenase [Solirubrobacterales bacterium]|nr:3-hydroxybutyryl-CoA dehydrogenase [Solirubrobacterales bacterium]